MGNPLDLSTNRFGRLTVLRSVGSSKHGGLLWLCACDCGGDKIVSTKALRCGDTRSCGCLHREKTIARSTKHGLSRTAEYVAWIDMKRRCENAGNPSFGGYGKRGIRVCDRWNSFGKFFLDMGKRPAGRYSLDRIDNDGDYSPENCRWATASQQQQNKRCGIPLSYRGKVLPLSYWARLLGLTYGLLYGRIFVLGWPVDRALTEAIRRR